MYFRIIAIIYLAASLTAYAQSDSLYFKNLVKHSDQQLCTHSPPKTSFTAFLNNDKSKILIEDAPRWDPTGMPNIEGNGSFGVELSNFSNPDIVVGDSVFIRFTCGESSEQGLLSAHLNSIPWFVFPQILILQPASLPQTPQNVSLQRDTISNFIELNWDAEVSTNYLIYRRELKDTIFTGAERKLYTLIAENIVAGYYVDNNVLLDKDYAYLIFPKSSEGIIGSHSEVLKTDFLAIDNINAHSFPSSVRLTWDNSVSENLAGYNIYRRTANSNYGAPIAYSNSKTAYTDSRLFSGHQYFYKVKARNILGEEIGISNETEVTTLSSTDGFYSFANLKVAVVIYKNTNRGQINTAEVPKIKAMLDLGKKFYWQNSKMKLNCEFDYYEIEDHKIFPDPEDSWGSMLLTGDHLETLGVMNTQYDIVFRITTAVNGYWSYGIQHLGINGPERKTGFSQVQWPVGTGVVYPASSDEYNFGLTWVFVHEVQHAMDAIFDTHAHPEDGTIMYHGDQPWLFPVACGEHYDFQSQMFRYFTGYETLDPEWGDIYETADFDNDQFPDSDSLLSSDEVRFGSSNQTHDSDNDQLSDREEYINGTYYSSNPLNNDSDGDSILDGEDIYPRYPISSVISRYTPVIDGIIETGWTQVNDEVVYSSIDFSPKLYLNFDDDWLYVAIKYQGFAIPELSFDFDNDGFWSGAGNTIIKINPNNGTFTSVRTRDASSAVRDYAIANGLPGGLWDDDPVYQSNFGGRVFPQSTLRLKVKNENDNTSVELAIPKNEYANLTLETGSKFGMNIYYKTVNGNYNNRASTFDQYDYAYFSIENVTSVQNSETIPFEFKLMQNYPNPFNPSTNIEYQLDRADYIKLVIYNSLGEKIKELFSGEKEKGFHSSVWTGINSFGVSVPSGVYFISLQNSEGKLLTKKMLLLR